MHCEPGEFLLISFQVPIRSHLNINMQEMRIRKRKVILFIFCSRKSHDLNGINVAAITMGNGLLVASRNFIAAPAFELSLVTSLSK